MEASEVMSSPAITVAPDRTIRDAIAAMLQEGIGSVVVGDAGPVGVLSRSDVLRAVYHGNRSMDDMLVNEQMTEDPVTIDAGAPCSRALEMMETHGVKRLPVVDNIDLVGMLTTTDIAVHQPDRVSEVRARLERRDEWTD